MAQALISTRNETVPIARGGWLDALRFIVAFLIILHHFQAAGPHALAEVLHPVFERGGFLLTNFFLIDSGYVLMRVYQEALRRGAMTPGDFVLKRVLRVVPAHLMMALGLAGLVILSTAAGVAPRNPEWFDWGQFPAQLFLVQSFGVPGGLGWNAPTWSISALIGCYLAFPWILKGLSRVGAWTALGLGVGVYLLANEATWAALGLPVWQMPMKYGFIRALPLFFLGMCLAQFASRAWIAPRLAGWTMIAATAAFAGLQWVDKNALASIACIGLIILAAGAIPVTRPSKWVEKAALVSFSMFISNEVVRIAWFGAVNVAVARFGLSEPVQWALWGTGVLAAVGFAFAFHFLIDAPLQDRIKAWIKARRRASPTPTAPQPA
ncbi:acyltransferase [Brevundimonas sp.]|jgi:peptidoglycan/LPS O-acetylase OafA/YrhL|uniref:acyltransferase family protein n=1 Tax=Brevundimonas sp. TaxID=1871086 RepID=UPI002E106B90|nr:acyltransferase [Brevundimonas sp.]